MADFDEVGYLIPCPHPSPARTPLYPHCAGPNPSLWVAYVQHASSLSDFLGGGSRWLWRNLHSAESHKVSNRAEQWLPPGLSPSGPCRENIHRISKAQVSLSKGSAGLPLESFPRVSWYPRRNQATRASMMPNLHKILPF